MLSERLLASICVSNCVCAGLVLRTVQAVGVAYYFTRTLAAFSNYCDEKLSLQEYLTHEVKTVGHKEAAQHLCSRCLLQCVHKNSVTVSSDNLYVISCACFQRI